MYIQTSTSVATVTTNDNVLAGNQFEFSPITGVIEIGLNQSATGFEIDVMVGSEAVVTRMIPLIKTTAPVYPDDFTLRTGVMKGDRIVIRARNTSGGTLVLLTTVRFTRLA